MARANEVILVIEDDRTLNRLLVDQLRRSGLEAEGVLTAEEARAFISSRTPQLAVLDIRLPDSQGLETLAWLREHCPVVVLTAYGSIDQAVQAMHEGAAEYLVKPVARERLVLAVRRALETVNLKRDLEFWKNQVQAGSDPEMVGRSKGLSRVRKLIRIVSTADTTVLIEGESGVGKELVAAAIHRASPRADGRFVAIDCCTLQENLLESELFGHERGAFTGAERKKEGLVEIAEGGTVFLDEIGEITPTIQAKLLRVLETGQFRRLGGTRDLTADVRFVAATNRSLADMAADGTFREDLYYRLSAFVVTVPPLRERRDDIANLASFFLASRKFLRHVDKRFDPETIKQLEAYSWPGNIRELRNVVERGLLMSGESPVVLPAHIQLPTNGEAAHDAKIQLTFDTEPTLEEVKSAYLSKLLDRYKGRRNTVAKIMGISERNTYRIIKKFDLGSAGADQD